MGKFEFNVDDKVEAKKIGRIKTTLEVDMYLRVCGYEPYTMIDSNKEERVLYGVKHAIYFLNPDTQEVVSKNQANTLVDAEELDFTEGETKLATFKRYFTEKALEVYKNDFVEDELACCKRCGEPEGLHQIESAVVYAKCKCDLKAFLSQEKCKK
ncbi:hypothetical protein ABE060_03355 [Bacillus rugosus]|uniref:hypothetical protein n=1 Tax=Bacillus rugosus TaxID=2715209 RepID=UPI00141F01C3|nr:hypothetical protein [Bacillus rugosus]NUF06658.1 hypothetical protein [Bacillus rugosus]